MGAQCGGLSGVLLKGLALFGDVTQLVAGQGLNRHRDYRNHEEYLNYTINFGKYEGGHLEMLRNGEWQSCAVPLIWTEFTADIIEHRVREVTEGERFSVTLFTPSYLERLSERDWMNLESHGFPVHLYAERASAGNDTDTKGDSAVTEELVTGIPTIDEVAEEDVSPPVLEAQQAEKGISGCSDTTGFEMFFLATGWFFMETQFPEPIRAIAFAKDGIKKCTPSPGKSQPGKNPQICGQSQGLF